MDLEKQLYETEAMGWKRGIYDDIKQTLRAPFVNWIFRTNMANHPKLFRQVWFNIKPIFTTKEFADFSVQYRDVILSKFEEQDGLPKYRRQDTSIPPAEYRELKGQLATFDIVSPRLAVLFEIMDRILHDKPVGDRSKQGRSTTEPFPDWLDGKRGLQPTMIGFKELPDELDKTISDIQNFHGYDEGLPSIYRCAAQWPEFLNTAWADLSPILESPLYEELQDDAYKLVQNYSRNLPYNPLVSQGNLEQVGFSEEEVNGLKNLFQEFNRGTVAAQTVTPLLIILAGTVDAQGPRTLK